MLPVVVTPDAEQAAIDYLRPALAARSEPYVIGVKVGTVVGTSRPFVHIRRIGGASDLPGFDQPRLDVVVYHTNDANRIDLAKLCWAIFKAAASDHAGTAVVSYVSTTLGPRVMPDPANPSERVGFLTVDLLIR